MTRETMEYDVAIVGAGPAGLSAAICLKQRAPALRVCVLEKGAEVGAHILSGCIFDPVALNQLLPGWKEKGAPLLTQAAHDRFLLLTEKRAITLPVPPAMKSRGCYIISLGNLCRFLAREAESLGVEIFPGFPAAQAIIDEGQLRGVITGEFGRAKDGSEKPGYQPGVEIRAAHTLLAEGCRGSLSETLMREFGLRQSCDPQTYALGIKEIWEIDPARHKLGSVMHSVGWPLSAREYGGGFLYHAENNQALVGLIAGLDYKNPYFNPYQAFQQFKSHPAIARVLEGGRRIAYGARALNEGGIQAIPQLAFPGGALIGDGAGFLNIARIKGSHTAMMSGICAADAIIEGDLARYPKMLAQSWVYKELRSARNLRPAFAAFGLWGGLAYAALDQYILQGHAPWTLHMRKPDFWQLKPAAASTPITYPPPDGKTRFDLMSSVYLSNTHHEENQPCHLHLKDPNRPAELNFPLLGAPEERYCPAGVYEYVDRDANPRLVIHAANCVHCKTCDIKDPTQNIVWAPPEGGGGPNYEGM